MIVESNAHGGLCCVRFDSWRDADLRGRCDDPDAEGVGHLEHRGDFFIREVRIEGYVVRRQGDTGGVEFAADLLEVVNRLRIEAPLPYRFTPAHSLDGRNRVLRLDMAGPEFAMREPYCLDAGDDVVERPVTEAVALRAEADAGDA